MKTTRRIPSRQLCRACFAVLGIVVANAAPAPEIPDLTKDRNVDRKLTYNLGATGLRGWIFSRPATHFDGLQGRTTAASRQILVTHVGAKSPADGVVKTDDVIIGAGGKSFVDDARKSLARAIQQAESTTGELALTCWRAGETRQLKLKLRAFGPYAATAPYQCRKSALILDEAAERLAKEPLNDNWCGAISGVALLASGKAEYLPQVRGLARRMAAAIVKADHDNTSAWEGGYRGIFLCEYYLLTADREVAPAITRLTSSLARGQSMYGTFGHGYAELTPDGKPHGSIPPYGPVNQAGLAANLAILLGSKCGVKDPEVMPAVERASKFFAYFTDKGTIPYGEHEPYPFHDNNGKSAMSAVFFGLQPKRAQDAEFFARMSVAGFKSRECGHTGQGFSYLWGAPGANVGGPGAAAAFFAEASWHFDLVRRCDGSFTYDGGEQYGPGKTHDDTYYGDSSYYGLSPNATYVLTYALPLKKIMLTGRDANPQVWLDSAETKAAVASGDFDLARKNLTAEQLVAAFRDWSPVVRGWAAEELAQRPEAKALVPALIQLAAGTDLHAAQGAAEALGKIKDPAALPVLVGLLKHDDRWLRFKAAHAIRNMGGAAKPALAGILTAVATTAEPLQPVNWADPVQLTHGQLAAALFEGPMVDPLKEADRGLLYQAVRVISRNADGMARAKLRGYFENHLTLQDVQVLAPDILAAVITPCPADKMFSNEIRMGGFKALTKYHFKEGIDAGVIFAQTQGGHGSERRTGEIMQALVSYGRAARPAIPGLRRLIDQLNHQANSGGFPKDLNKTRVADVENAIQAIQSATTEPQLRSITRSK